MARAAENAVLEAIGAQDAASNMLEMANLAMVRAVFDTGNQRKLVEQAAESAEAAFSLRALDWKKRKRRGSLDTLLEIYELLEKQKVV